MLSMNECHWRQTQARHQQERARPGSRCGMRPSHIILKKLSRNWTLMFAFTYSYSRFVLSELSPHYSHSVIKPARVPLLVSCIITDIVRVTHFLYRIIIMSSINMNKKAQSSLTNPRDAKACQNCSDSTCLQRCR